MRGRYNRRILTLMILMLALAPSVGVADAISQPANSCSLFGFDMSALCNALSYQVSPSIPLGIVLIIIVLIVIVSAEVGSI